MHKALIIVHIFKRKRRSPFYSHAGRGLERKNSIFSKKEKNYTIGEKATMVLACISKHVSVSASCQYWQVLKTFKEVKTLFSVYKSSVL